MTFALHIDAWPHEGPIPARFAFGKPGDDGPFSLSDNISPALRWSGAPEGTKSFAVVCHDPDVPSSADDVNQEGKTVPADLPRVDFFHWVLIDLSAGCTGLDEGAGSDGVTPRGKPVGPSNGGLTGVNNYTDWFAGDADMGGTYGGYDGPCPPWNDSIVHHYHFHVFALDVDTLGLEGEFRADAVREAMEGHVLASALHVGTYSMNPAVPA
ncbi:MAG: YbhB/YbcL family Raf kinase inhibitor-like protein [Sandaracinaceae bacterium]